MTLEQSFKALKAAFVGKNAETEQLSKEIVALNEKNAALNSQLSEIQNKFSDVASISAERDALKTKVEELSAALANAEKLNAEAANQIESASAKAAKIVAAAGATPVEVPVEANAKTGVNLWEQYLEIKDPVEKMNFYNKNRSEILKHLGVR